MSPEPYFKRPYVYVTRSWKWTQKKLSDQRRNEGGTIPWAPKCPNNVTSTFFNRVHYICFRKTSVSNMGAPNLLLPRALSNLVTPLFLIPRSPAATVKFTRRQAWGNWSWSSSSSTGIWLSSLARNNQVLNH